MVNLELPVGSYVKTLFKGHQEGQCNVVGLDDSGKSALIRRYKRGDFVTTIPTMGFQVDSVGVPSEGVTIAFRELAAGCMPAPGFFWKHYGGPDRVFLFLIDSRDRVRIEEALENMQRLFLDIEMKYLAVAFTKRDAQSRDGNTATDVIAHTKEVVDGFKNSVDFSCEVYDDLDELSAKTGAQMDVLLTRLARAVKMKKKQGTKPAIKGQVTPQVASNPIPPKPSREELLQKVESGSKDTNGQLDTDEFMRQMVSGELEKWDHHSHLRAGFLTLLECVLKESVVFDAADLFLERLGRMLESAPGKFRNTSHRTLTIFWLHQIYLAMVSFRMKNSSFPARGSFNEFLMEYPDIMYGQAWESHYSRDLLFSQEAKDNWRLPDLEPLPQFVSRVEKTGDTEKESKTKAKIPAGNAEILKKFAYATVKTVKRTGRRRAAVINETLPLIQSYIMGLRARSVEGVEPYSETQAYFWIQMLHAAVESFPNTSGLAITRVSFESFTSLFPDILAADDVWKKYYTSKQWNSIEGRMQTVLPTLKPLPNVLQTPDESQVGEAVTSTLNEKYAAEANKQIRYGISSMEELLLETRCTVKDISESNYDDAAPPETHAALIYRIFKKLVEANADSEQKRWTSLSSAAWEAVSFLREQNRFTYAIFWSTMVLGAFSAMDSSFHEKVAQFQAQENGPEAEGLRMQLVLQLLTASPELCCEGLWTVYYSDEAWKSEDAGQQYVLPDKRSLPVYVEKRNEEKEDLGLTDWEMVDV